MKKLKSFANPEILTSLMKSGEEISSSRTNVRTLLRVPKVRDLSYLGHIDKLCFDEFDTFDENEMKGLLDSDTTIGFIIRTRKKGIGYIIGEETGSVLTLNKSLVRKKTFYCYYTGIIPKYREMGLFKLLSTLFSFAVRDGGYDRIILHSVEDDGVISAYKATGYSCVKKITKYYFNGDNAWLMEKRLDQQSIAGEIEQVFGQTPDKFGGLYARSN